MRIDVRIHRKVVLDKIDMGDFDDAMQQFGSEDVLVFDRFQIPRVARDGYVIISRTEGYRVGAQKPIDGRYVRHSVGVLTESQVADFLLKVDLTDSVWVEHLS